MGEHDVNLVFVNEPAQDAPSNLKGCVSHGLPVAKAASQRLPAASAAFGGVGGEAVGFKPHEHRAEHQGPQSATPDVSQARQYLPTFPRSGAKGVSQRSLGQENQGAHGLGDRHRDQVRALQEWHLDQALQTGARDEEIYEPVDVAIEMGGGQAGAYARFVLKAMDDFKVQRKG